MDVNPLLEHVEKHLKKESLDEELDLSDFQLLPSNIDENSVKIKSADEEMIPALFKNLDVQSAIQSKDISEDEINGILIKIQENIPDITSFLKICQQKPLNEKNNEIYIAYNLIFCKDHLIILFSIENTVENLMLKNLKLQFNSIPENSSIVYQESIESIKFGTSKKLITVLKFSDIVDLTECDIDFISNFDAHDFDPKSNQVSPFGSEEEYTFPSLIVELQDVLLPLKMKKTEFVNCWKSLTTQQQIQPTNEMIPLPKQKGDAKQILQSQNSIMEYFGFPWSSVSTKNNEIGFSSKTMDGNALLVTLSISDRGKKYGHNLEGNVLCSDKSYTELIVNDLFSN
ncbi:MAG: coatomer subunit gamma [Paramarteilia canceri]